MSTEGPKLKPEPILFKMTIKLFFTTYFILQGVHAAIQVVDHPKNATLSPGQNVTLQCIFSEEIRQCAWNQNKKPVPTENKEHYHYVDNGGKNTINCSLTILHFSTSDIGRWQCQQEATGDIYGVNSLVALLDCPGCNVTTDTPTSNTSDEVPDNKLPIYIASITAIVIIIIILTVSVICIKKKCCKALRNPKQGANEWRDHRLSDDYKTGVTLNDYYNSEIASRVQLNGHSEDPPPSKPLTEKPENPRHSSISVSSAGINESFGDKASSLPTLILSTNSITEDDDPNYSTILLRAVVKDQGDDFSRNVSKDENCRNNDCVHIYDEANSDSQQTGINERLMKSSLRTARNNVSSFQFDLVQFCKNFTPDRKTLQVRSASFDENLYDNVHHNANEETQQHSADIQPTSL